MPFDGGGNFSRVYDWTDDRDNGIKIQASRMDGEFDDIASALNVVFFRNGLVPMSGDLAMGANDITGIASGTAAAPSIQFSADPNSGVYLGGVNNPAMAVNGVKRFELTTTGAVVTGTLTVSGLVNGGTLWTSASDGAGSGLDADLLDGSQGSEYAKLTGAAFTGPVSVSAGAGIAGYTDVNKGALASTTALNPGLLVFGGGSLYGMDLGYVSGGFGTRVFTGSLTNIYFGQLPVGATAQSDFTNWATITSTGMQVLGNTVWHAGNDGSGSGLDADTLDGVQGSGYAKLAAANVFSETQTVGDGTANDRLELNGNALGSAITIKRAGTPTCFIGDTASALGTGDGLILYTYGSAQPIDFYIGGLSKMQVANTNVTIGGNTVWHAGNDGAGSGLDADTLDGAQGSAYAQLASANTFTSGQTINSGGAGLVINSGGTDGRIELQRAGVSEGGISVDTDSVAIYGSFGSTIGITASSGPIVLSGATAFTYNGSTVWHAGNDGSGSGLDADTVDGIQASAFAQLSANNNFAGTANAIASRVIIYGASASVQLFDATVNTLNAYMQHDTGTLNIVNQTASGAISLATNSGGLTFNSNTVWHAGNDGSGSGLDADTVDGIQASGLIQGTGVVTQGTAAPSGGSDGDIYFLYS